MATESAANPSLAPTVVAPPRERLDATRLLAGAAVFLALAYFGAVLLAAGGSPGAALRATAIAVMPSVLLTFFALRIGRRLRWFDGSRVRLAIVHAGIGLLYGACWSVCVVILFAAERWVFVDGAAFEIRFEFFGWSVFTGLLLYGGVAGAAFGVEAITRLRAERARLARAETLRARAELAALRAQLNPHFLFNTLHTVLGLVRRDPSLAEEALQDLGDVLRYALDVQRGHDDVPLRDELEFVQRYLAIERVRLGDRLRVEEAVDPDALRCRLPAFTIQPIVENAIRYAVAPRSQGGLVKIEAHADGDRLSVVVSDDGAEAPPPAGGAGLGLSLVRQRLEAAFGPSASLVARRAESGFVVEIRVPRPPVEGEQ